MLATGPIPADYLTLDDVAVRAAAGVDPEGFIAALGPTTVIDEVQRAPELLLAVAARSGSLARYDALGRDAGIDGKTAKSHVDVLERLFLVPVRRPWHVNLGKRQVKAPKLYVSDSGLLAGVVGIDRDRLANEHGLAGALFERFVATELERQASWSLDPPTFWHYREGERKVDVIAERPSGEIVGFEVKASATVRERDLAGLIHLRDKVGDRLRAGIVVYTGERTLPFGDRLFALPLRGLST